ncbi:MAG: DUF1761 domain-containing protein [Gammaproteobacteria bacterium]|nr:DUF1761 domain-containing protein [Gammaproteobacteria bacterium]
MGDGLLLGFMVWLGFVAPTGLAVNLFSTRPIASWTIDAGFQLIALLIAATVFAVWR